MPVKYDFHPIANIFPLMPEAEQAAFALDIATNGLHVPIVLYQEKILDGRNRYLACLTTEVEPRFTPYHGDQPLQYVLSLNLKRRHLTQSQKATVAADLANLRREDTLKQNASDTQNCATIRISQSDAADMIGVSHRYVQEAVSLKKTEPQLYKKVQAGEISLQYALQQAHPRKYRRRAHVQYGTKEPEPEALGEENPSAVAERFWSKLREEFPEITPEKVSEITEKVAAEWPEEPTTQDASDEIQRIQETYPEIPLEEANQKVNNEVPPQRAASEADIRRKFDRMHAEFRTAIGKLHAVGFEMKELMEAHREIRFRITATAGNEIRLANEMLTKLSDALNETLISL